MSSKVITIINKLKINILMIIMISINWGIVNMEQMSHIMKMNLKKKWKNKYE